MWEKYKCFSNTLKVVIAVIAILLLPFTILLFSVELFINGIKKKRGVKIVLGLLLSTFFLIANAGIIIGITNLEIVNQIEKQQKEEQAKKETNEKIKKEQEEQKLKETTNIKENEKKNKIKNNTETNENKDKIKNNIKTNENKDKIVEKNKKEKLGNSEKGIKVWKELDKLTNVEKVRHVVYTDEYNVASIDLEYNSTINGEQTYKDIMIRFKDVIKEMNSNGYKDITQYEVDVYRGNTNKKILEFCYFKDKLDTVDLNTISNDKFIALAENLFFLGEDGTNKNSFIE
ncbi:TPA: hypothetical protein KOR68_002965 [Clostridioides difficile]|nr:hypothetical protein [Clostridioides difficile]